MTEQGLTPEREAEIRAYNPVVVKDQFWMRCEYCGEYARRGQTLRHSPGCRYTVQRALFAELDALRAERDQLQHAVDWQQREIEGCKTAITVAREKRDLWKAKAERLAEQMVSCRGWTREYWLADAERAVGGDGK